MLRKLFAAFALLSLLSGCYQSERTSIGSSNAQSLGLPSSGIFYIEERDLGFQSDDLDMLKLVAGEIDLNAMPFHFENGKLLVSDVTVSVYNIADQEFIFEMSNKSSEFFKNMYLVLAAKSDGKTITFFAPKDDVLEVGSDYTEAEKLEVEGVSQALDVLNNQTSIADRQNAYVAMANWYFDDDNASLVTRIVFNVADDADRYQQTLEARAAEGDTLSVLTLANLAEIREDFRKMEHWLEKAAELGDVDATVKLARLYAEGENVRRNRKKSSFWYRRAGELGSHAALYEYGRKLEDGDDFARNIDAAIDIYFLAATAGSSKARNRYEEINPKYFSDNGCIGLTRSKSQQSYIDVRNKCSYRVLIAVCKKSKTQSVMDMLLGADPTRDRGSLGYGSDFECSYHWSTEAGYVTSFLFAGAGDNNLVKLASPGLFRVSAERENPKYRALPRR